MGFAYGNCVLNIGVVLKMHFYHAHQNDQSEFGEEMNHTHQTGHPKPVVKHSAFSCTSPSIHPKNEKNTTGELLFIYHINRVHHQIAIKVRS